VGEGAGKAQKQQSRASRSRAPGRPKATTRSQQIPERLDRPEHNCSNKQERGANHRHVERLGKDHVMPPVPQQRSEINACSSFGEAKNVLRRGITGSDCNNPALSD
jgi:hypothetical protein